MSSSPLYLAIVVVWLIVLVPMLLRKDSAVEVAPEDLRREDVDPDVEGDAETDPVEPLEDELPEDESPEDPRFEDQDEVEAQDLRREEHVPAAPVPPAREPRSRIIARRRRRTSVLTLLNVGTLVAVGFGLGPWWVVAPPVLLMAGHLVLLREAAKADAELRYAHARRARRRVVLRERRETEERRRDAAQREAEIISLRKRHSQVYDQYADARLRAAGD